MSPSPLSPREESPETLSPISAEGESAPEVPARTFLTIEAKSVKFKIDVVPGEESSLKILFTQQQGAFFLESIVFNFSPLSRSQISSFSCL
jgi:hypothetical protein